MVQQIKWWGYLHMDDSVHLKRWFGDPEDLAEAKASPFVKRVVTPFPAKTQDEALEALHQKLAQ